MPNDSFNDQRDLRWIEQFSLPVELLWKRWHRFKITGLERIPSGAALYVGNHSGGLLSIDTFLFANAAYRMHGPDAIPYGLAHDFVMNAPIANRIMRKLGAVRAGHKIATKLFDAGKKVLVYPGGDIDSLRPYRERNNVKFDGRMGYIRLALRNNVPIIPLVAHGAQGTVYIFSDNQSLARFFRLDKMFRMKVMPLMVSFPWGITLGPSPPYVPFPSKITMEVLSPIYFDRSGEGAAQDDDYVEACDHQVWLALQCALSQMAIQAEA